MLLDDPPESIFVWSIRSSLIHQDGRAVRHGTVDHVAVSGNPTAVRGAEMNIVILEVKNELTCRKCSGKVAPRGVGNAFGFAG